MARRLQQLYLFEFFLYVIAGWIIINLWQRFVENFFYGGLGLDRELPYHNFVVVFVMSGIFLIVVSFVSAIISAQDATSNIENFNYGTTGKSSQNVNGGITKNTDENRIEGEKRGLSRTITPITAGKIKPRESFESRNLSCNGNSRQSRRSNGSRSPENRLRRVEIALSKKH